MGLALSPFGLLATSLITREEALASVFPGATIKAERIFLTEHQLQQAARLAGGEIPSALLARYIVSMNGKMVGRAYVDTHVVRTKKESLIVCLDEQGTVKRVEVTAFLEPTEYQGTTLWYRQYQGKQLNSDLNLHRAIRPIAGATLTANAATQAVRRVLAIDQVLKEGLAGGSEH